MVIESFDDGVYYRLIPPSHAILTSVAEHLRKLADGVERNKILELEVQWDGGDHVDSRMKMVDPLKFTVIEFEQADTEEP